MQTEQIALLKEILHQLKLLVAQGQPMTLASPPTPGGGGPGPDEP